jgi:hypothetical protein
VARILNMATTIIPGITGDLVWSDTYKSRVGSYPSKCLPSEYTIYYSAFTYKPNTQPYQEIIGGTPLISGFTSAVFPMGLPAGSVQRWQTVHRHIFANTSYNINEPVILTQQMIDSGIISLPNYVFEIVSATKNPIDIPPIVIGPDKAKLDVYNINHGEKFNVQFSLALDSSYLVKSTAVWSLDISNDNFQIDSKTGLLTITVGDGKNITISTSVHSLKITATNSMGTGTKNFTLEVVSGNNPSFQITETTTQDNEELLDKAWKSIFANKHLISDNLLKELVQNKVGMYYRLDNGTDKSTEISKQSGYSYTANHNDASSKKISVDLSNLEKGDIVYVSYCAVREHYFRQVVSISWFAVDMGYLGFIAYPTNLMASNYRFYKWKVPSDSGTDIEIEGWRCVEAFNMRPNIITIDPEYLDGELGFLYGEKGKGNIEVNYLPIESTYEQIYEIVKTGTENKTLLKTYSVNQDESLDGHGYSSLFDRTHNNSFVSEVWPTESWYKEYSSRTSNLSYSKMVEYCIFNTHSTSMKKRDIDKFAYPADLANIIYDNLKKGEDVSIANFDYGALPDPNDPLNAEEFDALSLENFSIDPIKSSPQIINTANASGTSTQMGLFPNVGVGTLFGEFASNIIKESMKKGTKILVESKPIASRGSIILSLLCQGSPKGYVDCIMAKNENDILVFTNNSDGFLSIRKLKHSEFENEISQVYFVPEKGGIDYSNPKTDVDSYPVVGISGLLGDGTGVFPSNTISFSQYAPPDAFVEYYYGKHQLSNFVQRQEIGATTTGTDILIQLGRPAYTGQLKVECTAKLKDEDKKRVKALVLFSSSNKIESAIDNISVPIGYKDKDEIKQTITLNYLCLKGDTIKISFDNLSVLKITNVSVLGINDKYSKDFLDFNSTTTDISTSYKIYDGALFVKTDFSSSYVDDRGHIYSFFEDTNGGVSAINSVDNGTSYNFQYNVIPKVEEYQIRKPFITQCSITNNVYLFVSINHCIYSLKLSLSEFAFENSFKTDAETKTSIKMIVAAGNNNKENIEFILKNNKDFSISYRTKFSNIPVDTPYFSAYQCNNGELRLSFLDDKGQWQCNYSYDNGLTWIDLWACMQLCGPEINEKYKTGEESQDYPYGIKIHPETDSVPESLYIFKSDVSNRIYLFYIYKGCLLCKISKNPNCPFGSCKNSDDVTDYEIFKKNIEESKSYFIDGNIENIKSELDKNVILKYKGTETSFTEYRTISAQRVCAHQMPNGYIRVYYKTANDNAIRSAHLAGTVWAIDDMMYPTLGKIPDKDIIVGIRQ